MRKPAKIFRAGQQTLSVQMRAMREYANKPDWSIAVEEKDVGSSAVA